MAKSNRLPEKWFRRALWLVAFIFAGFLIGLGSRVVDDLPRVERALQTDQFVDQARYAPLRLQDDALDKERLAQSKAHESAELALEQKRNATRAERETFTNWLATRSATQQSDQNPEVIERTHKLDALKGEERQAQMVVERLQTAQLASAQRQRAVQEQIDTLMGDATVLMEAAQRKQELRVFAYRLALTLPLLVIAGYLFVRQRKSRWWPFVWGFIFFALFAFFVELVPYLPSYGGYVRYLVGIVITVLVGRYAVIALNNYLERKKAEEAMPDAVRRETLSYDTAQERLSKSVCPGCERPTDLKDPAIDFCPHCGICLFNHCGHCHTRKSAFVRFCQSCGVPAQPEDGGSQADQASPAGSLPSGDAPLPLIG